MIRRLKCSEVGTLFKAKPSNMKVLRTWKWSLIRLLCVTRDRNCVLVPLKLQKQSVWRKLFYLLPWPTDSLEAMWNVPEKTLLSLGQPSEF